jgi:hypothetical protein
MWLYREANQDSGSTQGDEMINRQSILTAAAATFAGVFLFASNAGATPLAPGASGIIPGVFAGALTPGNLLADTGIVNYANMVIGKAETGQYEARVYNAGGGLLDFVYDFNETSSSTTAINSVTMGDFGVANANVFLINSSTLAGTLVAPLTAQRSADGNVIKFNFSTSGVGVGQASTTMVIEIESPSFTVGLYSLQNGVVSQLSGYQPAPVPEPASFAMIGAGLIALGMLCRKRA